MLCLYIDLMHLNVRIDFINAYVIYYIIFLINKVYRMPSPLIDTHCHLDFDAFDKDRAEVLEAAVLKGVCAIIHPAITVQNFDRVVELSQNQTQHPDLRIYPTFGLHPCFIHQHQHDDLIHLEKMIQQYVPIAVGECGLDFFMAQPETELPPTDLQREQQHQKQLFLFEGQLKLARHYQLPVIIHARKSLDHVINLIKKVNAMTSDQLSFVPPLRGVVHCFSGSLVQANRIMALGFYVGFGGPITYPRATRLRQLVKTLPLTHILLESDAPDQPILKEAGQRNTPKSIHAVCQEIATLRGCSFEAVAIQTTHNARTLFNLTR